MGIILLTVVAFALIMTAMAVGVIFSNRCLHGSCGGPDVKGPDGESLTCATCPNRQREDDELLTIASAGVER